MRMQYNLAYGIAAILLCAIPSITMAETISAPDDFDIYITSEMARNGTKGLAVAQTTNGKVDFVKSYGIRNANGEPLTTQSIMYGASLTKSVFAYTVLQLADEGKIDLDASIASYLSKPLPEYTDMEDKYSPWQHLAGDDRWKKLTPRILLNHSSGFANFYWLEADKRLKFHFDPGSRYAYSGDGIILLQFILEQGLGIDVGSEMQRLVFDRFGMKNSSMIWRNDFSENLADGWDEKGETVPHDERGSVRAAGSLDISIADFALFSAAITSEKEQKFFDEMSRPQLKIGTASQFPSLQENLPVDRQIKGLSAGLGVVTFEGPSGGGFFKGGHNDSTGNMWICLKKQKKCAVLMSNDVRAEALFPGIIKRLFGDTGMPWHWEYGSVDWAQ